MKKQGVYLNDKQVTRDAGAYTVELVKSFIKVMELTVRMDVYSRQQQTFDTSTFVSGKEIDETASTSERPAPPDSILRGEER